MTLSKGLCPRYNAGKELLFKNKSHFAPLLCGMEDNGGIDPSELCPFFLLPAAFGIIFSPSCWCYWGVQPLWAVLFHASHGLQPSLMSLVPTFPGAAWVVPFQGHFSLIYFFDIFYRKIERLQRPSSPPFLVVYRHCPKYSQCRVEK